jgi:hypothetical protein
MRDRRIGCGNQCTRSSAASIAGSSPAMTKGVALDEMSVPGSRVPANVPCPSPRVQGEGGERLEHFPAKWNSLWRR